MAYAESRQTKRQGRMSPENVWDHNLIAPFSLLLLLFQHQWRRQDSQTVSLQAPPSAAVSSGLTQQSPLANCLVHLLAGSFSNNVQFLSWTNGQTGSREWQGELKDFYANKMITKSYSMAQGDQDMEHGRSNRHGTQGSNRHGKRMQSKAIDMQMEGSSGEQ
ncbi:hypothetical protein ILYODFUR_032111 [Ilyodon furcidens]|uniref:Uncharacterized protein n=1 Tax=Ilyodon furcidens TaxID=33524 RepID=A0ABV0TCS7_9TELE